MWCVGGKFDALLFGRSCGRSAVRARGSACVVQPSGTRRRSMSASSCLSKEPNQPCLRLIWHLFNGGEKSILGTGENASAGRPDARTALFGLGSSDCRNIAVENFSSRNRMTQKDGSR